MLNFVGVGRSGLGLKDFENWSFKELGSSQSFKFLFQLYCYLALAEMKQYVNFDVYEECSKIDFLVFSPPHPSLRSSILNIH